MGLYFMILMKKFNLLFLIISVSLLSSTSFSAGGGRSKFLISELGADPDQVSAIQDGKQGESLNEEEVSIIYERLLRANTKDYGRYDPSPSFSKPPHKLIPN